MRTPQFEDPAKVNAEFDAFLDPAQAEGISKRSSVDLESAARRWASLSWDCQARLIANTMRQSGDKEMTDIEPLGK
jgi:hypothetical protein